MREQNTQDNSRSVKTFSRLGGILRGCFILVRPMASGKGGDKDKTKDKQIKKKEHQVEINE